MKQIQTLIIFSVLALGILQADYVQAKETAKVLPQGIRRFRVVGVVTGDVKQTYNDSGDIELLSRSLNRSVTVNDLVSSGTAAGSAEAKQLGTLVDSLNALSPGLGDELSTSNLYSDFHTNVQIYLPAFEYGVTNKLSIGARMPIVKRSVRNQFNVDSLNNASAISAQIGNINPAVTAGLYNFGSKQFNKDFFEKSLFTDKGYEAPHDFEATHVGDLEVGGKLNFFKNDQFISTVLLGVRVPTGSSPSLTNIFDQGTGKGAWGIGTQLFQEMDVGRGLSFGGAAKLSYNFADTKDRAVPKDENDTLPSLLPSQGQVQSVKRNLGMMWDTEISSSYRFAQDAFGLWTAYQYSGKAADRFSGPGNFYYSGLSKDTDSDLHAGEVGIEYSTIPAFRRGAFKLPMDVSLLYNTPIRGRNSTISTYTRLDVMFYF